ncbi:MAG TPA: glycosyltransferase [Bryobacteraceae bacterium]|jgi:glycosyltransferase involved in cell wall biosynthesis
MQPDSQPLVSFVVLCYNTEQYVGDCIANILRMETDIPFEIVALDDHSPDRTWEIIQSFDDPRVRAIRNERNLGHSLAIEKALRATRGKYVARIDSDDRHRPNFLDRTVPILEKFPEVGLVYGDASVIGPEGQEYSPDSDSHHNGKDYKGWELVELLAKNFVCAPTMIVRREFFIRHLPVPPNLAFSDWYFTVYIARETQFYYVNSVLADYRVHPGNMHSRIFLDKSEERSIFWMLDQVYGSKERNAELQEQKLRARQQVYGSHYFTLAEKYFGAFMTNDARRCYWEGLKRQPSHFFSRGIIRRFAATLIGRNTYERVKAISKAFVSKSTVVPRKAA